jgi:hypothetical protein
MKSEMMHQETPLPGCDESQQEVHGAEQGALCFALMDCQRSLPGQRIRQNGLCRGDKTVSFIKIVKTFTFTIF